VVGRLAEAEQIGGSARVTNALFCREFVGQTCGGFTIRAAGYIWEVMAMNEEQKAAALASAVQALSLDGAVAEDVLGRLWDESFEQGRLAALDELQDRFCVCMQ
jgi:hypothetical protein